MKKNILVAPVVKWVGGKRQLIKELKGFLPSKISSYCEPFVGGGALLFELQPSRVCINDINHELVQMYEVIHDSVEELIEELKRHPNISEHFYNVRDWDRNRKEYEKLDKIKKAARIIYLNKTCYNGLFRVNSFGEFNTPFGHYKNPNIVNESGLRAVNLYFNKAKIEFYSDDYEKVLKKIRKSTFVYLDPPYDPISDTSNFTGYSKGGFDKNEQVRLKNCCDFLNSKGIKFMLSNSETDFIRELYSSYNISIVKAKRSINSNGNGRGEINEVVVRNYE